MPEVSLVFHDVSPITQTARKSSDARTMILETESIRTVDQSVR